MTNEWKKMSDSLVEMLALDVVPVALTFTGADAEVVGGVAAFDGPMSAPSDDGRSGRVPASCVFWMEAATRTFSTAGADHGNCSVGRWVHGFATLDEIAGADDVGALFASGWVTSDDVGRVRVVDERPAGIVYGPLGDSATEPDVVVLRLNPKQMMVVSDALPAVELSGKPQCQVIARAKAGGAAVSMGCALSRERTGMPDDQLTCALPAGSFPALVERLTSVVGADSVVRRFAGADAARFGSG